MEMCNENLYEVKFNGVKVGALGLKCGHLVHIMATDRDSARLKLYESYEHITIVSIREIK
jgi:hypothetical protein